MAKIEYRGHAVEYPAGEAIGGHRAVAVIDGEAFHADKDDPTHLNAVVGITFQSFTIGSDVCILEAGLIKEPSWNWTAQGPIYLGSNGQLTQIPPTTGNLIRLGVADTPTDIRIKVERPIVLV